MKNRFLWASALALAVSVSSQMETKAAFTNSDGVVITNGVIIITTRAANDNWFVTQSSAPAWDADDNKGPGFTPGDATMGTLLQDNGYSVRLLPDKALSWQTFANPLTTGTPPTKNAFGANNNPQVYYNGGSGPSSSLASNVFLSAMLVVVSGSGSSADVAPPNTNGIPIVCGESAVIGSSDAALPTSRSEIFLYTNRKSNNYGADHGLYMRVLDPNHPIMQGIPLDATNRVKIWRDPYPDENAFVLTPGGNVNYQVSWTGNDIGPSQSVPAPGLEVLGTMDYPYTNFAVFAVMEKGGTLGDTTQDPANPWLNYTNAPSRLVHFFVNENGSNNSRRNFNALTVWGRIIFLRTCKWAMGETLTPFQGLGVIDVGLVGPSQIKLSWQGSIHNNYRIDGTTDFVNWVPIVDSIVGGISGTVSRTLDISQAPQAVFMRVAALP